MAYINRYEFTCTSASRQCQGPDGRPQLFTKGQKVVRHEDDPMLRWFRSGGFTEALLTPIITEDKPGKPDKSGLSEDVFQTPIEEIEGIAPITKKALKEAKFKTLADLLSVKDEKLLATPGIAAVSLKSIRDACEALVDAAG
jgi:hypothetical protein